MIPEIDEGEAVELTDVSKPEGVSLPSSLVPIVGYLKTPIFTLTNCNALKGEGIGYQLLNFLVFFYELSWLL